MIASEWDGNLLTKWIYIWIKHIIASESERILLKNNVTLSQTEMIASECSDSVRVSNLDNSEFIRTYLSHLRRFMCIYPTDY